MRRRRRKRHANDRWTQQLVRRRPYLTSLITSCFCLPLDRLVNNHPDNTRIKQHQLHAAHAINFARNELIPVYTPLNP